MLSALRHCFDPTNQSAVNSTNCCWHFSALQKIILARPRGLKWPDKNTSTVDRLWSPCNKKTPYKSDSLQLVDHLTQLICIWIFICCQQTNTKYLARLLASAKSSQQISRAPILFWLRARKGSQMTRRASSSLVLIKVEILQKTIKPAQMTRHSRYFHAIILVQFHIRQ